MAKVKLTILESRCRDGLCRMGDTFIVDNVCPPLCHELWSAIYPQAYVLLNGGTLDCGDERVTHFTAACPDGGRVKLRGERIED